MRRALEQIDKAIQYGIKGNHNCSWSNWRSRFVLDLWCCGSKGVSGSGVVRELLKQGGWVIRAVTRKPEGEIATQFKYVIV